MLIYINQIDFVKPFHFRIDIENNNVKIVASEIEEINENGRIAKSISNISKSLLLPKNTQNDSITTQTTGSSVIIMVFSNL